MTTINDLTEQDVLALSAAGGEPDWLRDRRQEAFKVFTDLAWPDIRAEEWRYTDPRRFDLDRPILENVFEKHSGGRVASGSAREEPFRSEPLSGTRRDPVVR
ncbi:MAG: hypothetical protein ACRDYX_19235, partial [Egibacteraceae bacterium]